MTGSFMKSTRSYAFQRVLTAAAVFSSLLFGAWAIEQSAYAQILLIIFLGKFLHIANLGATAGFFVSYYGKFTMFEISTLEAEFRYCILFLSQLLIFFVPAALLSIYTFAQYTPGIMAFILLIPIYVLEPVFRLRRKFYMSLVPDILMSLTLFITAAFSLAENGIFSLSVPGLYLATLGLLALALYLLLLPRLGVSRQILCRARPLRPRQYLRLAFLGMPVYLGTALFMLASGLDRFLLPLHVSPAGQAVYMLSYQLATGAMIFLASVNFINTVDLGEAHKSGIALHSSVLQRKLLLSVGLAALSLVAVFAATLVLERFFLVDYDNLLRVTMTLALGLSVFFVAGAVTPILAYLRKQTIMTIVMGIAAGLILLNNIVSIRLGWDILWLSSVTSAVLGMYGILALLYTFRTVAAPRHPDALNL